MKLKNSALQELYDTLVSGGVSMSHYADSPVYEAFKECDEKLSGSATFAHIKYLENRCENLERSNKALRDINNKLSDNAIELAKKNERLEKDIDIRKCSNEMLLASSMESISEKRKLENEIDAKSKENSTLVSANADLSDRLAKLQRNYERIDRLWYDQIQENTELKSKIADLQREKKNYETIAKEREDLVKERDEAKQDSDAWQRRAKYAEKELDLAKRNKDGWRSRAMHAEKRYAELRKENADLSGKITELQKKGDDLTKKGEDLQQEIEELKKSRKHLRRLYVCEGARKLWEMLQNVNDSQPNEFDVECESMEDVVGMDLDDFLDAYKKWQEEKEQNETDHMRKWLDDFCAGQLCPICPLGSNEYKCGRGYSFKKINESDTRIIPDEDIKRYYEKASGCGVAPNEEDHQLDYGDAVRVPWKSYDYMYIEPEGKHIRLFDPKTHAVVLVSVKDNLTYQGYTIILCDEDDIRKIWKDKK